MPFFNIYKAFLHHPTEKKTTSGREVPSKSRKQKTTQKSSNAITKNNEQHSIKNFKNRLPSTNEILAFRENPYLVSEVT